MAINVVSQVSGVLLLPRKGSMAREEDAGFECLFLSIGRQQLVTAGGTLLLAVPGKPRVSGSSDLQVFTKVLQVNSSL